VDQNWVRFINLFEASSHLDRVKNCSGDIIGEFIGNFWQPVPLYMKSEFASASSQSRHSGSVRMFIAVSCLVKVRGLLFLPVTIQQRFCVCIGTMPRCACVCSEQSLSSLFLFRSSFLFHNTVHSSPETYRLHKKTSVLATVDVEIHCECTRTLTVVWLSDETMMHAQFRAKPHSRIGKEWLLRNLAVGVVTSL